MVFLVFACRVLFRALLDCGVVCSVLLRWYRIVLRGVRKRRHCVLPRYMAPCRTVWSCKALCCAGLPCIVQYCPHLALVCSAADYTALALAHGAAKTLMPQHGHNRSKWLDYRLNSAHDVYDPLLSTPTRCKSPAVGTSRGVYGHHA